MTLTFEHRPDPNRIEFWFCNKCGYVGEDQMHDDCNYSACSEHNKQPTAVLEPGRERAECSICQGTGWPYISAYARSDHAGEFVPCTCHDPEAELREGLPELLREYWCGQCDGMVDSIHDSELGEDDDNALVEITRRVLRPWLSEGFGGEDVLRVLYEYCEGRSLFSQDQWDQMMRMDSNEGLRRILKESLGIDAIEVECGAEGCGSEGARPGLIPKHGQVWGLDVMGADACARCSALREALA